MFRFSQYIDDKAKDRENHHRDSGSEPAKPSKTAPRASFRLGGAEPTARDSQPPPVTTPPPIEQSAEPTPDDFPAKTEKNASSDSMQGLGLYDHEPVGAYALAESLGIEISTSRQQSLQNAKACLQTFFLKLSGEQAKGMIWPMMLSIAADLETICDRDANIATIIDRGERSAGDCLLWHSIYTAVLAMELSTYTKIKQEASVQEITAAALMHDVGLVQLAGKADSLDIANEMHYRKHSDQGADIALAVGAPDIVVTMIRQHHEQIDSGGFPAGLHEGEILNASQIIGISDIFERAIIDITNSSQGDTAAPPGLSKVFSQHRSAYQIQLIKDMMALIGYYPVGSLVELSNRSICEVIAQNQNMPLRPVVKVIVDSSGNHPEHSRMIDLHETAVLSIVRAIASKGVR